MTMGKQRLIDYWRKLSIVKDERLIQAFKDVPRELFIRGGFKEEAYDDRPLPIGSGQTISQPTTVLIMTHALELREGLKVLEVGSGSGWQAAIIGKIVGNGRVISTEVIPELCEFALNNLHKAGITNVRVIECDGSQGYEKEAPYDRIIVTAACPKIPGPLIDQLQVNGILIAPVGALEYGQDMVKLKKKTSGIEKESLGSFMFVPLKGRYGY